jgi:hypothetical protein
VSYQNGLVTSIKRAAGFFAVTTPMGAVYGYFSLEALSGLAPAVLRRSSCSRCERGGCRLRHGLQEPQDSGFVLGSLFCGSSCLGGRPTAAVQLSTPYMRSRSSQSHWLLLSSSGP